MRSRHSGEHEDGTAYFVAAVAVGFVIGLIVGSIIAVYVALNVP